MDFIEEVLDSTQFFEAPRRFYQWASLAAISAVLKDKVFFNMADNYLLYPNIYVLLYGPSAVKKGPPIALAEDLVLRVDNTRVIDGRSSIEAVIKELGTMVTRPGKENIKDSCGFMVSGELSSSIISNNSAMDIMTNLFDRQYNEKEWKYRLKVAESARLMKPTITWLTGTNESLFRDFIPEKNLHGGLIGRMLMIEETEENCINSLMFKTKAPDKPNLAMKLKEISKIQGEFSMDTTVRHMVNQWYIKYKKEIQPKVRDLTGFSGRVEDLVLKVAMIISCGRRSDKKIEEDDINEAAEMVMPLILPTSKIATLAKKVDSSEVAKRGALIVYLASREGCRDERARLLRNVGLGITAEDLDKIAQDFIQRGVLEIDNRGGQMIYRLKTEIPAIAEWLKLYK